MRDPRESHSTQPPAMNASPARFSRVRVDVFSAAPLVGNPAAAGFLMRLVAEAVERLGHPIAALPETFALNVSMNRTSALTGTSKPRIGSWLRLLQDCGLIDFSASKAGTRVTLHLSKLIAI